MSWISNLFSKHWRNIHLAIIALLSIALAVSQYTLNPLVKEVVFGIFHSPFSGIKNSVIELSSVASENERLRKALVEASVTISMLEEADRENARLRSVLGFEPPTGYSLVPAEVISIAGDYLPVSAVINKGADDSILVDQPVINQQGLIGRIASVSASSATVQLLTDPSNRVAVRLADTRMMGIIKYSPSQGMILDNFPVQDSIEAGDTILSSGLGGIYPAGLRVGIVRDVVRPRFEPFYQVCVEPAASFRSVEELFILRGKSSE